LNSYQRSQELLSRAELTIPSANQTFSKGRSFYPRGASPCFLTHGIGSHVWDVDGNEYIDFVNGLATMTLGYNDADVTEAVTEQLKRGVIFSLPHPIEMQVAETLVEMIPCAEMVRFGKNGSDVTTAAIRLARAYTKRDHVAVCGYHGWQDWYIGSTTRNLGVPQAVSSLTHSFKYNDVESLTRLFREYSGKIAAVILEPMNAIEPLPGFLESVKEVASRNGALLIFDEIVTGFRFAKGGAQEHFSVTPDLATFGKAMANGYPVSALVGSARIMQVMDDIYYSLTYGGETLSLTASLATMRKMTACPVIEKMTQSGLRLKETMQRQIERYGVAHFVGISGHPTWIFVTFRNVDGYTEWEIKTLFLQEMLARGILTLGTYFVSYAHEPADLDQLLIVFDEVLSILKDAVETRSVHRQLRGELLMPIVTLR
jgi:glutamate-1-semialdehyde 2,1-aminomutase